MPQAIRDTLPYFLGAVDREGPTLRNRLYQLRRDLRTAESRLEDARRIELRGPSRTLSLLAEALDAGLVARLVEPSVDPAAVLREALNASSEDDATGDEFESEYRNLTTRSQELLDELRALAERAQVLRLTSKDHDNYAHELSEQVSRLETLDILPTPDEDHADHCPLCGSAIGDADATIGQIAAAAEATRTELQSVAAAESATAGVLDDLETRASVLRQSLRETHDALAALSRDRERIRAFREQSMARAYIKGRIIQHLEELEDVELFSTTELESTVRRLRQQIADLEEQLDPDNERQQVVSRLNVIGEDMTQWAERLGLEHAGGRARIDAAQLTVVVDTRDGPIPLERMGSASNWVGYHLVSHLALHKWFTEQNRPVPRFLMIDQPTQAFYPPDVTDITTEALSDDDRESVEAMFSLMRDLVSSLEPGFQLIVMDHANLSAPWFQSAVVEVWRGGNKLVPTPWLEADDDESV
jgi:hypothetical protein